MPRTIRYILRLALLVLVAMPIATAQDAAVKREAELAGTEKSLSERFDRLELLAGRLAELSKSTQPRRAELLQQLVAKSREKDVPGRFDEIVEALQNDSLGNATKSQTALQTELQAMLDLLLQEDRDRQIESERQRISKYLAELNKIIRQQRGIKARTAGGDEELQLGEDQERASDKTGELGSQIEETELKPKSDEERSEGSPSDGGDKPSENNNKRPGGSESKDPSEQGESKQSEGEPSDTPPGDSKPSDSQQGDSRPSEGQPSQSQPSQSKPSQSPPSQGEGQPSEGGQPSESQESSEQSQTPSERAVEKLKKAQQRMQQAQERLKEAQRKEAVEEQEAALRELEQAKAELEKILRQLREEEMERLLVLLEARLRKMLEMQNQVYDETKKLDKSSENVPRHELEIASASLSRQEDQIVNEADRAMMLLKEDGSSVAFPEALQQARDDMQTVSDRLKRVKTEKITQALEEDIIATLEETLAALQKALKDLRDKKSQPQQGGNGGEPGEQALVDQLAELRMIRALQDRVNKRTLFYDEILEGQQAADPELLESLENLAERQEQIYRATHDLDQGTNQ